MQLSQLNRWGVEDILEPDVTKLAGLRIHRFSGRLLAHGTAYDEGIQKYPNSPLWGMHRVDLQSGLARRAKDVGVELIMAAKVTAVDFNAPAVTLIDGQRITGDLVVGADGLRSSTRSLFAGRHTPPQPTGHMAYRIVVDADKLEDNELKAYIAQPMTNLWYGPQAHAVSYPLRGGKLLNIALLVMDDLPEDIAKANGNLEEMKERFEDWDPILNRFLANVESVDKWRLYHLNPLEHWRSSSGTFVMIGDSCHPTLPYLAQGANSSFEDAAVLGGVLSHVTRASQIPSATELYESIRQERTRKLHSVTFKVGEMNHMPDGPEQEERDQYLAGIFEPDDGLHGSWKFLKMGEWIWGYDAYEEVKKAFAASPF
ncbi:hypothetical protein MMC22_009831 [Lobaria immixta]|nr:hypothetical protein [Lobaria immixta]